MGRGDRRAANLSTDILRTMNSEVYTCSDMDLSPTGNAAQIRTSTYDKVLRNLRHIKGPPSPRWRISLQDTSVISNRAIDFYTNQCRTTMLCVGADDEFILPRDGFFLDEWDRQLESLGQKIATKHTHL